MNTVPKYPIGSALGYFTLVLLGAFALVAALTWLFQHRFSAVSFMVPMIASALAGQRFAKAHGVAPSGSTKWKLIVWSWIISVLFTVASTLAVVASLGDLNAVATSRGQVRITPNIVMIGIAIVSVLQFFAIWIGYGLMTRLSLRKGAPKAGSPIEPRL